MRPDIQIGRPYMYDNIAILKAHTQTGRDEYGNPIETESTRTVFVQPRGVYASEFYNAAQLGLKPSITLVLSNRAEYQGEKVLEYDGKDYSVVRVDWNAQRDGISLICEEKVRNE